MRCTQFIFSLVLLLWSSVAFGEEIYEIVENISIEEYLDLFSDKTPYQTRIQVSELSSSDESESLFKIDDTSNSKFIRFLSRIRSGLSMSWDFGNQKYVQTGIRLKKSSALYIDAEW